MTISKVVKLLLKITKTLLPFVKNAIFTKTLPPSHGKIFLPFIAIASILLFHLGSSTISFFLFFTSFSSFLTFALATITKRRFHSFPYFLNVTIVNSIHM